MAFVDSLIGSAAATLTDPSPPSVGDSPVGYSVASLIDPPALVDSTVGSAAATLRWPHHPVAVWDSATLRYTPVLVWDGTALR